MCGLFLVGVRSSCVCAVSSSGGRGVTHAVPAHTFGLTLQLCLRPSFPPSVPSNPLSTAP
jgi:hypothetical protein